MNRDSKKYLALVLILILFGSLMVFSTSWPYSYKIRGNELAIFKNHILYVVLSLIAMFVMSHINIYKFKKYSNVIFIATLVLGLFIFVPGISRPLNNARRWIILGPITFMPSDFIKIGAIMAMSLLISRNRNKFIFSNVYKKYVVIIILVAFMIMLQPDLSTTFVIVASITAMYIVAGMDKKAIVLTTSGIVVSIVFVLVFLTAGYSRTSRIKAFIDPLKYRNDMSWQLIKSLFAVTNGSLLGVGLGNGRQKFTLSEAHNDFIFASIAEEFGFVGSVVLIGAFIYLALLGIRIANNIKDIYGKMVVLGITFSIGLQAFVNIGTATGIVPPTGVTLPFISYGGSSLLMTCVMIGMVLSISRYSKKEN